MPLSKSVPRSQAHERKINFALGRARFVEFPKSFIRTIEGAGKSFAQNSIKALVCTKSKHFHQGTCMYQDESK